jgi:hypothetical protein
LFVRMSDYSKSASVFRPDILRAVDLFHRKDAEDAENYYYLFSAISAE